MARWLSESCVADHHDWTHNVSQVNDAFVNGELALLLAWVKTLMLIIGEWTELNLGPKLADVFHVRGTTLATVFCQAPLIKGP